ncbi:MAG: NAD(P)/FAD-dependent oxidoreductase [Actinomycetota bacterium]|nr:NAD(P)/FAD-dependent oxidoreductase [Actinomycetota bacterium]
MNRLLKGALALGGTVLALGALRRALNPEPRYAAWERPSYEQFEKKVLIVGGGFAGFTAAKELTKLINNQDREDVGVMVLARNNFFTFWPMVASIVSSDTEAHNVAQPLRRALITAGASFRRAEIRKINHDNKVITAEGRLEDGEHEIDYDQLVLALGGEPNFFGIPGVEEHAMTMRGVQDAERVRNRVIERFEEVTLMEGEIPDSKLTFVVIGGGATGVETASELWTLVHEVLSPDYPNIDPYQVRIFLLEGMDHILPELEPALRRTAQSRLANQRIEVRTEALAEEITEDRVKLQDGDEIMTENVVWTAGNRPNAAIYDLGLPTDEQNGIKVDEYLRVEGHPNIWAVGDCAAIPDIREENGEIIPPNAQAAVQEGKTLAKNVLAAVDGDELERFEFKPQGQLVELGSDFAVNQVMGLQFTGRLASIFWRMAYLTRLDSPQAGTRIVTDWIINSFMRPAVTQFRDVEG